MTFQVNNLRLYYVAFIHQFVKIRFNFLTKQNI